MWLWVSMIACRPDPGCGPTTFDDDGGAIVARSERCGALTLAAGAVGDGDLTVSLDLIDGQLVPTVGSATGGTLRAVVLHGPLALVGEGAPRVWRQGYQSWSWSGVLDLVPPELDADGIPLAGGDGDALSPAEETPATSWWAGLVGRADGAALHIGALSAARTKFFVAFGDDEAWGIYGGRGEAIPLPAGGSVALDPLAITFGEDPNALWEDWADAVATPPLPDAPPVGWATWSTYYDRVTHEDVAENLEAAKALRASGVPFELFQVDDGWAQRWGDWSTNDRFPQGTAGLAAEIAAAGFTPGLWMAPFYVSRESATYAEHPDWWVRDAVTGNELVFTNVGSGNYAVIDATHAEAGAWMAAQVQARRDEGWAYLKLDFLYAGAQEGQRAQQVTGVEAYAIGMRLLRQAAGDAYVLACGAPLLPTVGHVEGFRTGADIAYTLAPDADLAFVRWQLRQTSARAFTNGRWWWADPDQILTRGLADPTAAIAGSAAMGGTWQVGDALPGSDLAFRGVETRGQRSRPTDPLATASGFDVSPIAERIRPDDEPPARFELADGTVVLINATAAPIVADGIAGTERLSGATASAAAPRPLPAGRGEIWVP